MKIASIDIQEFRQFKNLTLDLTYPKGHDKAGEPLDKVCIIGQSGTGKTNLLELIYGRTFRLKENGHYYPEFVNNKFIFKNYDKSCTFDFNNHFSLKWNDYETNFYLDATRLKSPFNSTSNPHTNNFVFPLY